MKIGIYTPYLDSVTGGEKYILTIAECLSFSHDVSIFWDSESDLEKATRRFNLDLTKVSRCENIFSQKFSLLKKLKVTQKFDAIIVLSDGSIPTVFSKKLFLHFQFPTEWIHITPKLKLKLLRVTKIFCNSYFTKSYIDKKFHVNSAVLYPPVDLFPSKGKKENIILTVGRFSGNRKEGDDFKKFGFMTETFSQMVKKGLKGWKLIIATSVREEEKEKFEKFKKSIGKLPIEFIINADNKSLHEVYAKTKIYWHASGFGEDLSKHPEKAEHFGISTVEAMGAGAVPVVINAGGQKEIVTDHEDGIVWNTAQELIDKTHELMKDKGLWEKLSNNAKSRAELFNKERFCKTVFEIIT